MVATMAHSPAVLGGYLDLSRAIKRAKLLRGERVSIAVQQHLRCASCLDSHTPAARSLRLDESEIELAKQGTASDAASAAVIAFGLQVLTAPARITGDDAKHLRGHGFSDREIVDVVGVVALNVLTGAFNLVAGLEPASPVVATVSHVAHGLHRCGSRAHQCD